MAGALVLAVLALLGAAARPSAGLFQRGSHEGRAYRLYLPRVVVEAPTEAPALPLVVALHGCWQTPEDFAAGTRLNEAAERRGLLVVYPAQSHRDNPSRCWNWFEPAAADRGEVAEILALVRSVQREQRVARDRVVVLGFSAGGFMAVNLACAAPDVVGGVGVMGGGPYRCGVGLVAGVQCMRGQHLDGEAAARACLGSRGPGARPVRASLWHGADDTVVSPANLEALGRMFVLVDSGVAGPAERADDTLHTVYRDAGGRRVVETWLVSDMGHAWSGGDRRSSHTYPAGPPATERMLDFLLAPP
ncbi:MAG: hypothetical protein AUH29_09265 [Candidatus Rokubacteria bacterium 13_1_40CM_69_27]|nr:MAG: hypothetical protein AUH29_09265 [Candidatus Rokubacteria bacterium 13_1_40CM_69_27]